MADNFNDPFAQNLIGLWDFLNSDPNGDTGLADGIAQDGTPEHGASISGGRLHLDGQNDRFDVEGNNGPNDAPFDLDEGTISVQFTQDQHVGSSPDTLVNRGEFNDASSEGFFAIQVTRDGKVQVQHIAGGESVLLSTNADFFDPGDNIKATYSWDKDEGLTFTVENLTDGTSTTINDATTGLNMDIGDNDDEIFTFGAREKDDGAYDHYFDGSIDYVAVYDKDIQNGPDGVVDGEESGELMELGYDDANAPTDQGGDKITNDGDLIFGNGGDDTINGAGGDDTIYGDDGSSEEPVLVRESFEWDKLPDPNGGGGIDDGDPLTTGSQDTGNVTVSYSVLSETGASTSFSTEEQNVDGIDDGPETIDDDSGLNSSLSGSSNGSASYELTFSDDVQNVDFNVNDIDGSGTVRITAFDADGNEVPVVFTPGSGLTLVDANTVTTDDLGEYDDPDSGEFSTNVNIAGPVSRIVIEHTEGNFNSAIWVTDVYFDAVDVDASQPAGGDDVIIGGEGADVMFGEGGDDTFIVGSGAEGNGDVISGGSGPDETTDNDVLDLRGAGDVVINDSADANDAGATTGTVTFENGETLTFSGIETILFDENGAPIANDDDITVAEDGSVTFDPTANDSDPDGDPLEVDSFTQPANGTVTENPDGTLTYTPDPDYFGDDSFTVTITDPDGATSTSTVNVTVDPVNDAPDANPDEETMLEDGDPILIDVLDNDTDVDPGDVLTITEATVPTEQGTVEIVGGQLLFTPAENYNGPATISYAITDGNGGTDTSVVTVNIIPVNDAPEAVNDIYETDEDTPITFAPNPADNDLDVDGDDLTVTDASVPAEQGTVEVDPVTGEVTFTPALNFNGPATITYTVEDPDGASDTGTITVNVGAVIDPPTANDDDAETDEDVSVTIDVLDNDTDPENQDLTITQATLTDPTQGTVDIVGNELVFTPADNFNGTVDITYSIVDTEGGTDSASVTVVVNPVNDLPVAVDDIVNTDEDTPITFNPAENDTDVESPTEDLRVVDATVDPEFGTVEVDPVTGEVTFTPALNYNGPAPITYTVEDPDGGQDTGTALVNVGAVPDAPEPQDDMASTDQGTAVVINVLDNDSDPDTPLADLTVTAASVPAEQGTVTFDGTTVTFTPAIDFVGTATISYTITDPDGLSGSANITVDVADVIGPVDGTDDGQLMEPGFADVEGDQIDGDDGINDTIFGNGGDDTIDGGLGDDTIDGGADDDSITGGVGDDSVLGGDGSDTLAGGEGADTLEGGDGDDDIAVSDGDRAEGGTGDDVFTIDDSDPATDIDGVIVDGGSDGTQPGDEAGPENGDDGDVLDLGNQTDDLEVLFDDNNPEEGVVDGLDDDGAPDLTFLEIEKVITGSGDDTIDANQGVGPIDVVTNDGDDSIIGSDGDDTIDAGGDDDTVVTGDGSDSVDGGDGDNLIDTSGPSNNDPLDPEGKPDAGYPGLFVGDDDPFNDLDTVTTGDGDDTISTGDDDDVINAGDGDNEIDAGVDDDTVTTGDGDDTIIGGEGNDSIVAGGGDDLIYAGNDPSVPDIFNIPDDDLGAVNPLTPDLVPDNGLDTVSGGEGNDTIFGADDNDLLMGDEGNDVLNGGIDDDTLMGGTGDDVLIGGQGEDSMLGGDGEDTFIIADPDDPLYQAGSGIGDVVDGGSGGTPVADNTAAPNEDWDVLDLRGSAPEGGSLQVTQSGVDSNGNGFDGFVTYFDENGDEVGRLDFTEIEEVIPCFTPGTLIATPRGERRVEDLKVGDRVITRDNGIQEIRWVGHRAMTGEELARAPRFNPILIRAGALGRNLPERDMLVSPQHRMLMTGEKPSFYFDESEVLVAAKHLTHLDGVDEVDVSGTTYIHVMFDQHEVILSDGAWSESFQPGDMTLIAMGDAQRAEIFALFPELDTPEGIETYTSARRALKKHEAKLLT
ncbi:MAG: tandem-95 repeat protein [Pseudomonadota bacterium]